MIDSGIPDSSTVLLYVGWKLGVRGESQVLEYIGKLS